MTLDVASPSAPELDSRDHNEYEDAEVISGGEYRREAIEGFLHDGAWHSSFRRWAAETDMTPAVFEVILELELIERYDFFWDSFAERVGFHAPGIPEDWKERDIHPGLDGWGTVSAINAGLTELGQTVCDVLKDEYIDWETEYQPPEDLPDFE